MSPSPQKLIPSKAKCLARFASSSPRFCTPLSPWGTSQGHCPLPQGHFHFMYMLLSPVSWFPALVSSPRPCPPIQWLPRCPYVTQPSMSQVHSPSIPPALPMGSSISHFSVTHILLHLPSPGTQLGFGFLPLAFNLSSQPRFPVTGPHQFQSLDCLSVGLSDLTTSLPQHRQERQEAPIISSLNFSNNVFTVCSLVLQFWHLSSLLSPGGPGMTFLEHRLDIVPALLQPCQRHPVVHRVTEVERLHVWGVYLPRADMSLLRSPVQMINPMVSHLIRTSERCHPPPASSPLSFWSHSA